MTEQNTKKLTYGGLLTALVTIGTMAIAIPTPMTGGYVNLGDGIILTIAYLFGGMYALFAGAIGSALADLLAGYAHWALFTFIIKGAMGFLAVKLISRSEKPFSLKNIAACVAVELVMVLGYLLCGSLLLSSFFVSLQSVPSNLLQGVMALGVFVALSEALKGFRVAEKE